MVLPTTNYGLQNSTQWLTVGTMNNANATVQPEVDHGLFRPLKFVIYSIIFCGSLGGNTILIVSIIKFKHLRTISNVMVLSLACSDSMLVILSIPFGAVLEEVPNYPFGAVGCRLLWPMATACLNSTVFTLLVIAIERFYAVMYPLRVRLNDKKKTLIALLCVHTLSILFTIPYMMHLGYKDDPINGPSCREIWDMSARRVYTVFLFLIQYCIPLPIIAFLYANAWNEIRKKNKETIKMCTPQLSSCNTSEDLNKSLVSQGKDDEEPEFPNCNPAFCRSISLTSSFSFNKLPRRLSSISIAKASRKISNNLVNGKEKNVFSGIALKRLRQTRRTLKMFSCVVAVMAICVLPNQVTWLWIDFGHSGPSNLVKTLFYFLTYTNCVLNPWIYGGLNTSFRKAYKRLLTCKTSTPVNRSSSAQTGRFASRERVQRKVSDFSVSSNDLLQETEFRNGYLNTPRVSFQVDDRVLPSPTEEDEDNSRNNNSTHGPLIVISEETNSPRHYEVEKFHLGEGL